MLTLLKIGSLAIFDSFSGMIACRIVDMGGKPNGQHAPSSGVRLTIEITARKNRAYKRGERVETTGLHIVPRNIKKTGVFKYRTQDFRFEVNN